MKITIKQRIGFIMIGSFAGFAIIVIAKTMIDLWPWDFEAIWNEISLYFVMTWILVGLWLLLFSGEDEY